jgi:hypothetical protein
LRYRFSSLSSALIRLFFWFGTLARQQSASLLAIIAIGVVFGTFANGSLFQAIGIAPNPGLPPVIYASASMVVFFLSALLASTAPSLFKPVSLELGRLAGILLVLGGLYLLAGGKVGNPIRMFIS